MSESYEFLKAQYDRLKAKKRNRVTPEVRDALYRLWHFIVDNKGVKLTGDFKLIERALIGEIPPSPDAAEGKTSLHENDNSLIDAVAWMCSVARDDPHLTGQGRDTWARHKLTIESALSELAIYRANDKSGIYANRSKEED